MNRDNRDLIRSLFIAILGVCISVLPIILFLLDETLITKNYILVYLVTIVVVLQTAIIVWTRIRHNKNNEFGKYDKNIVKLNQLMTYDKQRDEIEQEIAKLTRELMHSNVAQYIDVNRLAFSGQNSSLAYGSINYDNFLKQFGIQKDAVTVKEGCAAFLTPFNVEGNKLFEVCQTILGKVNIFLRKTDNLVEKDDILMNIVSLIVQSEFVLVNIDGRNPNVYYELGIAHAIGKPTILLSRANYTSDDIGFDIRQKRIILYENEKDLETKLLSQISMLGRNEPQ